MFRSRHPVAVVLTEPPFRTPLCGRLLPSDRHAALHGASCLPSEIQRCASPRRAGGLHIPHAPPYICDALCGESFRRQIPQRNHGPFEHYRHHAALRPSFHGAQARADEPPVSNRILWSGLQLGVAGKALNSWLFRTSFVQCVTLREFMVLQAVCRPFLPFI